MMETDGKMQEYHEKEKEERGIERERRREKIGVELDASDLCSPNSKAWTSRF